MSIVYTIEVKGLSKHPFVNYLKKSLERLSYEIDLRNARVSVDDLRKFLCKSTENIQLPVGVKISSCTDVKYVVIPTKDGSLEVYVDLSKEEIVGIYGDLPSDVDPEKLIDELNEGYLKFRKDVD